MDGRLADGPDTDEANLKRMDQRNTVLTLINSKALPERHPERQQQYERLQQNEFPLVGGYNRMGGSLGQQQAEPGPIGRCCDGLDPKLEAAPGLMDHDFWCRLLCPVGLFINQGVRARRTLRKRFAAWGMKDAPLLATDAMAPGGEIDD